MKSETFLTGIIRTCLIAAAILVGFGVLAWLIGSYAFFGRTVPSDTLGNYGSFLQGTTASLWALAGFFIIFVAFLIQNRQLSEQREQSKNQAEGTTRQNFENKFFQLINLHHKLVEDITYENKSGRSVLQYWYREQFKREYWQMRDPLMRSGGGGPLTSQRQLELTTECYGKFYNGVQGVLGHYFRNLYHIIKFVDESQDIDEKSKQNYATLLRAQLSAYEQVLLFYNCVHPVSEEFWIYVQRYHLFHNLDEGLLLDESHLDYFDDSAYETSGRVKQPNPRLERIRHPTT